MRLPLQTEVSSLLAALPPRATVSEIEKKARDAIKSVSQQYLSTNLKLQWEICLRNEILSLAVSSSCRSSLKDSKTLWKATEGQALQVKSTDYYDAIRSRLDLILFMAEQG